MAAKQKFKVVAAERDAAGQHVTVLYYFEGKEEEGVSRSFSFAPEDTKPQMLARIKTEGKDALTKHALASVVDTPYDL